MGPHQIEMTQAAADYCELIEKVEILDSGWLEELAAILPRLHAAVSALGKADEEPGHALKPDLDARFELFAQLRKMLGMRDAYWMEFDAAGGTQEASDSHGMSGSLADDLTDIYCELKHGLKLMDIEPGRALDGWRSGYYLHWGQHLVDAERHLYALKSRNQL